MANSWEATTYIMLGETLCMSTYIIYNKTVLGCPQLSRPQVTKKIKQKLAVVVRIHIIKG